MIYSSYKQACKPHITLVGFASLEQHTWNRGAHLLTVAVFLHIKCVKPTATIGLPIVRPRFRVQQNPVSSWQTTLAGFLFFPKPQKYSSISGVHQASIATRLQVHISHKYRSIPFSQLKFNDMSRESHYMNIRSNHIRDIISTKQNIIWYLIHNYSDKIKRFLVTKSIFFLQNHSSTKELYKIYITLCYNTLYNHNLVCIITILLYLSLVPCNIATIVLNIWWKSNLLQVRFHH